MNPRTLKYRFFLRTYARLILPILIPVLCFAFITWSVAVRSLNRQIDQDYAARVEGWSDTIGAVTDEMERLNLNLSTSPSVTRKLRSVMRSAESGVAAEEYETFSAIMDMIYSSFVSNLYVDSLYIYFDAGGHYFLSSDNAIADMRYYADAGWVELYRNAPAGRDAWAQLRTVESGEDGAVRMLTLFRRLYSGSGMESQGVLVLNIPQQRLNRLLTQMGDEDEADMLYVVNEEGTPLFGDEAFEAYGDTALLTAQAVEGANVRVQSGGTEYVVRRHALSSKGLWLIAAVPASHLYAAPDRLSLLLMLVIIVAVIVCAQVAYSCARRDAASIEQIMDSIERARNGQAAQQAGQARGRQDAYGYILSSVVDAFLQKDFLSVQLAERRQHEKVLELTALRAQLNPHFLFNTMETIKWKAVALTGGENPASDMIENLAQILRYALDAGEDGVTLREELEICGCYMAIQRVRYRESFSYEVDVPEAMMEERVMKLLFQPLLENSIYHGVKGKTTPTRIRLRARRDDGVLSLVVEDDGLGMSAQSLEKVRERLRTGYTRSGEHIGLYNTNKRIALVYGEGYGIRIDSGEGKGTRVEIRIPSGWPARGEAPQN